MRNCWYMTCLIFFLIHNISAQENLEIFSWKSFLSYQTGKWVTQSENNIIYASDQSILLLNKEDLSPTFLSKVDGLSDTGIDLIQYDPYNSQLVVIYANSNIDLVSEDGIFNIPDLRNNTTIIGSKKINDVHVAGPNRILFATDFGMIDYRSDKKEFGSTIFTNLAIHEIASTSQGIYAAGDDGLYFFEDNGINNFADFRQWLLLGPEVGLPVLYEAVTVSTFNNNVFFSDGRRIYKLEGDTFREIYSEEDNQFSITFLSEGNTYLMVGLRAPQDSRILYYDGQQFLEGSSSCIDRLLYSIEDEKKQIWFADNYREFRYTESYNGGCKRLTFNSPLDHNASDIAIGEDVLAVASGGVADNFTDLYSRDGIYLLREGRWKNIHEGNYPPIKEQDMLNIHKLALSPDNSKVILASFWNGILEYDIDSESSRFFGKGNSALQPAFGDKRIRVSDIEYDKDGNLWMTNFFAPRPLVVWTAEEEWYSFFTNSDTRVGDMTIDGAGNIWMVTLGSNQGLYVYNPGSDLSATQDDQETFINLNNSEISSSIVYTVATDLNGDVWVGTAEGAVVFDCGSAVFDRENCRGDRREVEVDSILAYLLETEEVGSIAIDGGNRKWFGTRNGIFVQSSSGDEQIAHFTVDNSPLFDNEIVTMTYDGKSGIMYISTNRGLQAIRTETTIGNNFHDNKVFAFPNPVPPDYYGPIAIKGLPQDAIVKITDLNGRLVYESQALGGQAIWYGDNLSGSRAESGVYLVFSTGQSDFGSPDSYVSKILLISD